MRPVHISEIPAPVREALEITNSRADVEDKRVEAATLTTLRLELAAAGGASHSLERAILTAIRSSRITARIPALCVAVLVVDPLCSSRLTFDFVGLFLGLSSKRVEGVFYANRKES